MSFRVRWGEDAPRTIESSDELFALLAEASAGSAAPAVVTVEAPAGTLSFTTGDPAGSALVYFPAGYEESGTGSVTSVGDPAAHEAGAWEPPQVAFLAGHHTEYPRWAVVPNDVAREALRQFLASGGERPANLAWSRD